MAYLTNYSSGTQNQSYYQGNNLGDYQFTSLEDIINQFIVAYVGEDKIIPKVRRTDVAFHAMRGLQELSFDTFKSVKSQQIDVPANLSMLLPHDYVNYTKLSFVDSAGIKHPLYPTKDTNNPFQIKQDSDGNYSFEEEGEEVKNGDLSAGFSSWIKSTSGFGAGYIDREVKDEKIVFSHRSRGVADGSLGATHNEWGYIAHVYQELDVSDKDYLTLSALGQAVDHSSGHIGLLRVGISTNPPDDNGKNFLSSTNNSQFRSNNHDVAIFDLGNDEDPSTGSYLQWKASGANNITKTLTGINVSNYNTVYLIVTSHVEFYDDTGSSTLEELNNIDNISVVNSNANTSIIKNPGNEQESSTWQNYKSHTPSENNSDDYEDDTYWPLAGSRYGLDPQNAQVNGSFYIDNRLGKINFSSNISGKTVILDYISDSLGTDSEMQVHKFAEEAMYKWIAYAILSTRSDIQEYVVRRYKKERFAEIRKAKLRLSNIKLEEITQILRGKSKQIKH